MDAVVTVQHTTGVVGIEVAGSPIDTRLESAMQGPWSALYRPISAYCAVQAKMMVTWAEMPRSPGHVFYDRLQRVLIDADFDGFAGSCCAPYYAPRMGAPSIPPGRYFRMHLVGYFEGIDSERGIEWRCADSLSLREFLRAGATRAGAGPFVAFEDPRPPCP